MSGTFQSDSNLKDIKKLKKELNRLNDNLIFTPGVNDSAPSFANSGGRNTAHGNLTGTDAVQPLIHLITNINDDGSVSGVFNKINLMASNVVIDQTGINDMTLKYILKTRNNGQRISALTVVKGKKLTIQAGGNIDTDADIKITDRDISYLIYSEDISNMYRIISTGAKNIAQQIQADPTNCNIPITLCYLNQILGDIISANGLVTPGTIIETLLETVNVGNGTQEYTDTGFISEPLSETVNVGNGTQEYKTIGFIAESITDNVNVSTLDLFDSTSFIAHVGDSITVNSTIPILTPYFSGELLTVKIHGVIQGTMTAGVDGSFTLTFFIVGVPTGLTTITISDGIKTAIEAFEILA
jgi:hypothetical protein